MSVLSALIFPDGGTKRSKGVEISNNFVIANLVCEWKNKNLLILNAVMKL